MLIDADTKIAADLGASGLAEDPLADAFGGQRR